MTKCSQNRENKNEKPKLLRRVLGIIYLIALIWIIINIFNSRNMICGLEQTLKEQGNALTAQQETNDELKSTIDKDESTIEEGILRDEFGYSKPNERVFIDVLGK